MARIPLAALALVVCAAGARAGDPYHGDARLRSDHADDDPGWRGEDLQVRGFVSVLVPNPPTCSERCSAFDDELGFDGLWGGGASLRWHPHGPFTAALTLFAGRSFGGFDGLSRFDVFETRLDRVMDIGRRTQTFGVALRVSPTLSVYFIDSGHVRVQAEVDGLGLELLPPVALTLGTSRLWFEIGAAGSVYALDPRVLYLVYGERSERWKVEVGPALVGAASVVLGDTDRDDDIENQSVSFGATARTWLDVADDFALELEVDVGITSDWLVRTGLGVRVDL